MTKIRRKIDELKDSKTDNVFQERLYKILEGSLKAGLYVVQNGRFRYVNDHAAKYWGYNRDELLGMESMNFVHPDDREKVRENAINILKGVGFSSYDFRTTPKDGTARWMTEAVTSIQYEGSRAVLGISIDITDQVEYRNRLTEMEALEASILDSIPHAVIGLRNRLVIFANGGVESVFGWKPDELIGKSPRVFCRTEEEGRNAENRLYTTLERKRTFSFELPCQRKDGTDIVCMINASRVGEALRDKNIVVIYEDITGRKRIEDAYMTMARSSVAGVYIVKDGVFVFGNHRFAKVAGYSEEELIGLEALSIVHPDDQKRARNCIVRMLRGDSSTPYEFRIITKDGKIRWMMEAVTSIPVEGGRAVLGNSMDITELIEARSEVERLKALETSFLEAIPHAVIGLRERHIVFANDGVESVFGWKPSELIGKTSRILYRTERDNREMAKHIYMELKKQQTHRTEFPCIRKDGKHIECMVSAARIGGSPKERNIVITYEDITESKNAKRELEKSSEKLRNLSAHLEMAREKERTRIARELHDELGQLLTALHMDIVLLNRKIPEGHPFLLEKTEAMAKLIDMTMGMLKRIYMDLRPGMLDHLGLAAAVGWQAREFEKRTGIKSKVTVDPEDMELDSDLSTTIFRIFQETLTNIARHAEATKADINLKVKNDRIVLTVKDNGKGITEDQLSKPNSYGLMGIGERVYHWGGKVKITGKKDKGTVVKVDVPLSGKGEE